MKFFISVVGKDVYGITLSVHCIAYIWADGQDKKMYCSGVRMEQGGPSYRKNHCVVLLCLLTLQWRLQKSCH